MVLPVGAADSLADEEGRLVVAKVLKHILSLRNPTHYLLTWLGLKNEQGRPLW